MHMRAYIHVTIFKNTLTYLSLTSHSDPLYVVTRGCRQEIFIDHYEGRVALSQCSTYWGHTGCYGHTFSYMIYLCIKCWWAVGLLLPSRGSSARLPSRGTIVSLDVTDAIDTLPEIDHRPSKILPEGESRTACSAFCDIHRRSQSSQSIVFHAI